MNQEFKNKTVLVTGAGSGIGREIAKRFVSFQSRVIAVSQTESKLTSLSEDLGSPENLITVVVDLSQWDQITSKLGELSKQEEHELDMIFAVNLKAPINLIKLVSPGMMERRTGSIVNVSSVASLAALDEHLAYASSKAALDMVTKISAKELGPHNVRVNSVNPTVVWTQMARSHWDEPEKKASMMSRIPMGRFVEIAEVIDPIIFLLSSKSSMVNGITLPIDGGFVAT